MFGLVMRERNAVGIPELFYFNRKIIRHIRNTAKSREHSAKGPGIRFSLCPLLHALCAMPLYLQYRIRHVRTTQRAEYRQCNVLPDEELPGQILHLHRRHFLYSFDDVVD